MTTSNTNSTCNTNFITFYHDYLYDSVLPQRINITLGNKMSYIQNTSDTMNNVDDDSEITEVSRKAMKVIQVNITSASKDIATLSESQLLSILDIERQKSRKKKQEYNQIQRTKTNPTPVTPNKPPPSNLNIQDNEQHSPSSKSCHNIGS